MTPEPKCKTPPAAPVRRSQRRVLHVVEGFVLAVVILYFGQPILMPFAVAALLTLLLAPVVRWFERRRCPRVPAVIVVVVVILAAVAAAGWAVSIQIIDLASNLPTYRAQIKDKVDTLRGSFRDGGGVGTPLQKVQETVKELQEAVTENTPKENASAAPPEPADLEAELSDAPPEPLPVRVVPESTSAWYVVKTTLLTAAQPLATTGVIIVLVIFLLIGKEDVRDRLVRLVGTNRLTLTTNTMDDIERRISRYLLTNALINGGYGLAVSAGLLVIGVDYALLWGFLATALRFVPYVGPIVACVMPICMAVIQFPGWGAAAMTAGMFIMLELVTNNLIEPLAYGRTAGVSILAILVSATFWTWVWGPIGLVLSVPMTVVLAVLSKQIPELQPLAIALGDERALEDHVVLYQRLLARDVEEAGALLEERLGDQNLVDVYDNVVIPALALAERDRNADRLTAEQIDFIWSSVDALLEDLSPPAPAEPIEPAAMQIVGCPVHDPADELALKMMANVLKTSGVQMHITSPQMLASELVEFIAAHDPHLVCLSALGPGGLVQLRYLLKRIRLQHPAAKVLVGRWCYAGDPKRMAAQITKRGANQVAVTLLEGIECVQRLKPCVAPSEAALAGETPAAEGAPRDSTAKDAAGGAAAKETAPGAAASSSASYERARAPERPKPDSTSAPPSARSQPI